MDLDPTADLVTPGPRVTMLLADHAAVADGKLYVSGGGWSLTGPRPTPSAIAVLIGLPWGMADQSVQFRLRLLTQDGAQVLRPADHGVHEPVEFAGEFRSRRPPGLPLGTPLDVPLAILVPPLQLAPGARFSWVLDLDGQTQDDWHLDFSTREQPSG